MTRNCPDCAIPMTREEFRGLTLDACPECAGIWFDAGEMRRAMQMDTIALVELEDEHVPAAPSHHPAGSPRRCPECDRVLDRFQYLYDSPIQLDSCGGCFGVWVDDGELRRMQQWLDAAHRPAGNTEDLEARRAAAIGELAAEHGRNMGRLAGIRAFCTMLSYRPGWGVPDW